MPFQSKAQRRKFYHLKSQGKMDQATIDEWEQDTPKNIPERLEKKSMESFFRGFEKRALSPQKLMKASDLAVGKAIKETDPAKMMKKYDQSQKFLSGAATKFSKNPKPANFQK